MTPEEAGSKQSEKPGREGIRRSVVINQSTAQLPPHSPNSTEVDIRNVKKHAHGSKWEIASSVNDDDHIRSSVNASPIQKTVPNQIQLNMSTDTILINDRKPLETKQFHMGGLMTDVPSKQLFTANMSSIDTFQSASAIITQNELKAQLSNLKQLMDKNNQLRKEISKRGIQIQGTEKARRVGSYSGFNSYIKQRVNL